MRNKEVFWAVFRTIINTVLIILDVIPGVAIPASIVESLNVITVIMRKAGLKVPTLTPNIPTGTLAVGILGGLIDIGTLELLPFPSSIIINGTQILHDIRPIHKYIEGNPTYKFILPVSKFLNRISHNMLQVE